MGAPTCCADAAPPVPGYAVSRSRFDTGMEVDEWLPSFEMAEGR